MNVETMAIIFVSAIRSAFEENEVSANIDLNEVDPTEMFTALILACSYVYNDLTQLDDDLLAFTHVVNRLVVQKLLDSKEEK